MPRAGSKQPFLSPHWVKEVRRIRDEYVGRLPAPPPLRMNLVVTDTPFGDGTLQAHVDTTHGLIDLSEGHIDNPEVTVMLDHPTCQELFIGADPNAAISALLSGRIRVQGDLARLLGFQAAVVAEQPDGDPARAIAETVAARIRAITAD